MNGLSPVVVVVFFIFCFLISFILGMGYELFRRKMKPPPKKKKKKKKKKKVVKKKKKEIPAKKNQFDYDDFEEDDIVIKE